MTIPSFEPEVEHYRALDVLIHFDLSTLDEPLCADYPDNARVHKCQSTVSFVPVLPVGRCVQQVRLLN